MSEGTADFFADACDIAQEQPAHRTKTHLVGHLVREVESATRLVLKSLPVAKAQLGTDPRKGNQNHAAEIDAILVGLRLDTHKLAAAWRSFVSEEPLHRMAHRDELRHPREPDARFQSRLDLFVDVLHVVLDAAEGQYIEMLWWSISKRKRPICMIDWLFTFSASTDYSLAT